MLRIQRLSALAATLTTLLTLLAGCKSRSDGPAPTSEPQKCTRVGQTCEFSPNKLGSCVMKDNCSEDCLVCQSQH